MLGYSSADIICTSKLSVYFEPRTRKTVRFSIMSADKYPSLFSRPMEAIVYIDPREKSAKQIAKLADWNFRH